MALGNKKKDYSHIKNFPEGAVVQKTGSHLYVIKRTYVYDPKLKRTVDGKRKRLGQIVRDTFYTNEEYKMRFQKGMVSRKLVLSSVHDPALISNEFIDSLIDVLPGLKAENSYC